MYAGHVALGPEGEGFDRQRILRREMRIERAVGQQLGFERLARHFDREAEKGERDLAL